MEKVNRIALHHKFQDVLDRAQAELDALQTSLTDTVDDDGQSNQQWVSEVATTIKHHLKDASRFVWD